MWCVPTPARDLNQTNRVKILQPSLPRIWYIERKFSSSQLTLRIHRNCIIIFSKVKVPLNGCGIPEIKRFQDFFATRATAIVVYNFSTFARGHLPLYDGTQYVNDIHGHIQYTLWIMYHERMNHFQPILNLVGATGANGYCVPCNKKCSHVEDHRCSNRCYKCYKIIKIVPRVSDRFLVIHVMRTIWKKVHTTKVAVCAISLNAQYIVIFRNLRDRAQIRHLARQVYPENPRFLEEAYWDATSQPYGYLLLDLKQDTPDNCHFRTCIFSEDEYQYVYVPRKQITGGDGKNLLPVVSL